MTPGARRVARELDDDVPGWPLWLASWFYRLGERDLDRALEQLVLESPRDVALHMLMGGARCAPAPMPELNPVRAALDSGAVSADLLRAARKLVGRPELAVMQTAEVLNAFADAGFRDRWRSQLPTLETARGRLTKQFADDPQRVIPSLSPRASLDPHTDRLSLFDGHNHGSIDCGQLTALDVLLSLWLRRRVVITRAPGRVGLAIGCGLMPVTEVDTSRLSAILAVLGDPRRLEIMRRCLERPRTTTELSSLLGITEGPVSRHLKTLERDGLIVARRSGRYVRYVAVVEELHLVGARLQSLPHTVWAQLPADPPVAVG